MKESSLNEVLIRNGVLALGLLGCAGAVSVQAQSTNAPEEMKPVVVTGSYIPTAETVGPSPVQTIGTEMIDQAGTADALMTLKKLVPGFYGGGNYLGSVNNNVTFTGGQGYTGESYVALRNLPTLVLINGQRYCNSALSGGQAVDLNSIPISMIERVEVLKDGASAIYGSDAVGGVINVITKQNYNGTEISGRVGFPTQGPNNNGLSYQAAVVTGITTEKTKFVAGAQLFAQNALYTKDRDISSMGIKAMQDQNLLPPSYISPSYPGKVKAGADTWILASSPTAIGASGYNASLTTPPVYAGQSFSGSSAIVNYNSYAVAHGYTAPDGSGKGPYLKIANTPVGQGLAAIGSGEGSAWPALNTTSFGTTSILEQNRRNFWANFEQELFKDTCSIYGNFLYSDNYAQGQLAPSPISSLGLYNIAVPANNPYNPFGIALGANGAATPRIRSRTVDFGNRTFVSTSDFYQIVGGLKGQITPDYGYNISYDYSQDRQEQQTRNAVNGAGLNQALTPSGAYDDYGRPLSLLTDANGNQVPVYNIFAANAGANASQTVNLLKTTLFNQGQSELWNAQGVFNGSPFSLPAGKFQFAAGGNYQYESLALQVDGLTKLGLVPGLNAAQDFPGGSRSTAAGFLQVNIPVLSKDQNIPGFYNFEIDAAGRYQTFNPGGSKTVPKVSLRWQPLDEQFTLRASYAQGFIAPSIYNLFGPAYVSNPSVTIGGSLGQVNTTTLSNPLLTPSDSAQYGGGIVITPKAIKNLTVNLDYYFVRMNNVPIADAQSVANSLNALGSASPFANGFTFVDGTTLTTPTANQVTIDNWGNAAFPWIETAGTRTSGFDIGANYVLPTDKLGKFTFGAVCNLLLTYQTSTGEGRPYYDYVGTYSGIGGLIPKFTITPSLTYEYADWTYAVSANYIPSVSDPGNLLPEYGGTEQGYTIDGSAWTVPSYFTVDMQLAYEFGKTTPTKDWYNGIRLAIGCQNVSNTQAPVIASAVEDNTDKNTYSTLGRFLYFEVSKKF